jgi:3alpha(or 20beta)-hydroxysteroid dehydrogenase
MSVASGPVALVTGAAGGIGAATARRLAAAGTRLMLTDLDPEALTELAQELGARSGAHDVTSEAEWTEAVQRTVEQFGRLDVLVNNAGVFHAASLQETTPEAFRRVLDVNATGVFLGMRAAAPAMAREGSGVIINISSVAGLTGTPNLSAYAASKWAVRGLTKVAARELARSGIRVVSVHPGQIDTPMNARQREATPAVIDALIRATPLRRLGAPEEVAAAVSFLASSDSAFMTGSELVLDGGLTI